MSATKAASETEQLLAIPKDLLRFLDKGLASLEKDYLEHSKNCFEFCSNFTLLFNEYLDRLNFQLGPNAVEKVFGKGKSPEDHWEDANSIIQGLTDYYYSHNKPGAVPQVTNKEYLEKFVQLGRRLKGVYKNERPFIYNKKLSELLF